MPPVKKSEPITPRLKRLPSMHSSAGRCATADRRGEGRHLIDKDVEIQDCADTSSAATIQDVSVQGCNIRCIPCDIRIGQYVVIKLAGLSSIHGIVRWARDGSAGIEFLHTIALEIVDEQLLPPHLVSVRHLG